jgi:predicted proteasome-type protease
VGPPIDLMVHPKDELQITRHRRFSENDPDLRNIHMQWEQALRKAVQELPLIHF